MKFVAFYHEIFEKHKAEAHPESPKRVKAIISELMKIEELEIIKPKKANKRILENVHAKEYIDKVFELCKKAKEFGKEVYLDPDTYINEFTCEASLYAIGSIIQGIDLALKKKINSFFAIVRPPGHHAGIYGNALNAPTQGFCIFNNVAIGASYLIEKKFNRILILDIDAHHGNGTQEIFYKTNKVFYISLHQDPSTIYPNTGFVNEIGEFEGKGYNLNIPLPIRSGDDVYRKAFEEIINPIVEKYKPKFILASLGFDSHRSEFLTMLNLTINSFELVFKFLKNIQEERKIPIGFVLEGGYNENVLREGSKILAKIFLERRYKIKEIPTKSEDFILSQSKETFDKIKSLLEGIWF